MFCSECERGIQLCGGPDGATCMVCEKVLENPANRICQECSQNHGFCEYCGTGLNSMPRRCSKCGQFLMTTAYHVCLTHGPMV